MQQGDRVASTRVLVVHRRIPHGEFSQLMLLSSALLVVASNDATSRLGIDLSALP